MPAPHPIHYYSSLLEASSSTKNLTKLKFLHARVIIAGIAYHDFIRAKLVSSYANCGAIREAHYIFSRTNRQPAFLYNTIIRSYTSLNLFQNALNCYREMRNSGKKPDIFTFPAVLKACAGLAALQSARQLHLVVKVVGFSSDVSVGNALVSMYSKCGDLSAARQVFDEMFERNVVSWSAMIAAYGLHGLAEEAIRMFDEMLVAGELPDSVTFTAVLAACRHAGLTDTGRKYFEKMVRVYGIRPELEHYTCMVDLLGRAGLVEEAERLVEWMEAEPDEAFWSALLSACRMHGKVAIAERVAVQFLGKRYALPCKNQENKKL